MIEIAIPKEMGDAPPSWRNFVHQIRDQYLNDNPNSDWGNVADNILNEELRKYNGHVVFVPHHHDSKSKMFFLTKQDHLVWALKWA